MSVTATLNECLALFDGHRAAKERGDTDLQARLSDTWLSGRRFVDREELDTLLALALARSAGKPKDPMPPVPNPLSLTDRAYFDTAVAVGFAEFDAYMQSTVAAGTTLDELKRQVVRAKAALQEWTKANPGCASACKA